MINTIPHSTAGSIVVGAYDNKTANTGDSFIFDLTSNTFKSLSLGNESSLYGVWHVGGDNYVIVGGARKPGEGDFNQAFIANYDLATNSVTDKTFYTFENQGGAISHFEGITAVDGGYNVIATVSEGRAMEMDRSRSGFYLRHRRGVQSMPSGRPLISRTPTSLPAIRSMKCRHRCLCTSGSANVNTYTATVPEPSTYALVALGLAAMIFGLKRRATA